MKTSILFFFLLFTLIPGYAQQADEKKETPAKNEALRILYTGNMGVLVTHKDRAVIIDGFHKEYGPDYVFPPESMVKKLITGRYKNHSRINVALVTHKHGDHFDAAYVKEFLEKNPESIAIGSQQIRQAVRALSEARGSEVLSRVKTINYDYKAHTLTHYGVKVKAFRCNHGNPSRHGSIQNIAYMVTLGDRSILHLGDTDWNVAEATLKSQNIGKESLDIAIIPYSMLLDAASKTRVNALIAPRQIVAAHLPPNISEKQKQRLSALHPGIVLLTRPGEEITYE